MDAVFYISVHLKKVPESMFVLDSSCIHGETSFKLWTGATFTLMLLNHYLPMLKWPELRTLYKLNALLMLIMKIILSLVILTLVF